jgi:hypothetical protein
MGIATSELCLLAGVGGKTKSENYVSVGIIPPNSRVEHEKYLKNTPTRSKSNTNLQK